MSYIHLPRLHFCFQSTLPTVFDDSLSYYEDVNKIAKYVNDSICTIENAFNDLSDSVSKISSDFSKLEGKFNTIQQSFNTLQENFDNLSSEFTDLNSRFLNLITDWHNFQESFTTQFNTLKNQLQKEIDDNLHTLETEITTQINTAVSQLQADITALETSLTNKINTDISSATTQLNNKIEAATTDLTNTINEKSEQLQTDYNSFTQIVESKITTFETKINGEVSNLTNLVNSFDSRIQVLDSNVLNLSGRVDTLENSLDNIQSEVTQIKTELNSIDSRVKSLEDAVVKLESGTITTSYDNYIVGGYSAAGQLEPNVSIDPALMSKWLKEGCGIDFKFKYYLDTSYNQTGFMFSGKQSEVETWMKSLTNVKNIVIIYDMRYLNSDFDTTAIQNQLNRTQSELELALDLSNFVQRFRYVCKQKNINLIVTMFPFLRNETPSSDTIEKFYLYYKNLKKLCKIIGITFIDLVNYQNFGNLVDEFTISSYSWINESDLYNKICGSDYFYTEDYYQQLYKVLGHKLKDYLIYTIDQPPVDN